MATATAVERAEAEIRRLEERKAYLINLIDARIAQVKAYKADYEGRFGRQVVKDA